jgi:hypothetical protein
MVAALLCLLAAPPPAAAVRLRDPLIPLVRRMDRYFQRHETAGVTLDSRYDINPSEAIRMSVVCQLLGYTEIWRVRPTRRLRRDIVERGDFLIARLDDITSHTPFDGMLAYSLLAAYEATGEARFLATGTTLANELEAIPTSQCVLNGGLMVAMATAEYARLTGDATAAQKTHDILGLLPPYQHPDGSFPHWCPGSTDVHYTDWMAMELILIQRTMDDARIGPILERMEAFMDARVDAAGMTHYQEPCPGTAPCTLYYYSRESGCSYDYDTRGITVEPSYSALLFDHFHSPKYTAVMGFLLSLEDQGTFADQWDYWPPPSDPQYPWTVADTSVANMSIIFWALGSIMSGRPDRAAVAAAWAVEDDEPGIDGAARPSAVRLGPIVPNPVGDACEVRFATAVPAPVSLAIYDPGGRRVRDLVVGWVGAGEHVARWDRLDEGGRACRSGLYFVRLGVGGAVRTLRVILLH